MIARITGTVADEFEKGLVIETAGVGYAISTPARIPIGVTATLFTHLVIREDAHELYGFETAEEKSLFATLISVSGVGPKTALHMLTLYPLSALVHIIRSGDAKAIALTPGIGKKTAEKIVIDLKDKLAAFVASEKSPDSDLVETLLSLGYKEHHIRLVIPSVDTTAPLQAQIRSALRLLGK